MTAPNILFILIDDLGWRDLSCYGSTFYETPHLDRLAEQGMLFSDAYASCPVCSPTRASIMSGKYPARVGVTQFIGGSSEGKLKDVPYLHYLPLEEKSLASALKDQGYRTWHVGKWHLGDREFYPDRHGFDVNLGGCHWGMPHNGYVSPYGMENLEDGPDGEYLTDRLTDEAINLIRNRSDQPFFLHLSHYAVHVPIQAPQALVEKYERKAARLKLDQIDPFLVGDWHTCAHKSDQPLTRRMLQSNAAYAAMLENLDTNIGRVLQTLDDEGIADNTMVVFTADNGGLSTSEGAPTCNFPLAEGKGWNYEGGTRVCQIVRWPGEVRPGSHCATPVTSTDFYPTFLEACGAPLLPEQHVDGVSLMPLLKEEGDLAREAIYWHYPHYSNQGGSPAASMVAGKWKLIENFEGDSLELYDLENDISETQNCAEQHHDLVRDLYAKLQAWQKDVAAKIPELNPGYVPKRPKIPNNAHV